MADSVSSREFRVLGPVEARADGRLLPLGHPRQRAVLAVLLLEGGQVVPASRLIDRIWGENPPLSVRNVLYGYIARLRKVLTDGDGGVPVARGQGGYQLHTDPAQVDLNRFRQLTAAAAATTDDCHAEQLLTEALGLWRGPALAGLDSLWLNAMRDTLEAERHAALLDLHETKLRLGQHTAVVSELTGLATTRPADERLIGQLMLALYRSGQQASALRWYDQTRHHLASELGADPSPQLRALHQQILRADPTLTPPTPTAPLTAGEHGAPALPRELPGDVSAFTGRTAELGQLDRILLGSGREHGKEQTTAAVISAVSGTAGVGKTALALHWAHRAAAQFPSGQLYVNLRGYDPGQPMTATDALATFLRSLGESGRNIPLEEHERAARYRSLLAGKRLLVVLDNAGSAEQVRPLLPGTSACAVVVTSRDSLSGLIARDGAKRIDLDLLPLDDAIQLLRQLIGSRIDTEPDAASTLAEQCARLPLALRITAELANTRPAASLADLAAELGDHEERLDLLGADDDPHATVRAVFSWSYQQLSDESARTFRLLGLHPGADISVPAAASLAGLSEPEARRELTELTRANLIAEHLPGRYAFHDLLRAYAADEARAHDHSEEREAAMGRVLDYYLHTATRAAMLINPTRESLFLSAPRSGVALEQPTDHSQATAWFDAESQVLLAAVTLAARSGSDAYAWQLAWAMVDFLQIRGQWQAWAATQRTALAAATRREDSAGQAQSSRLLASACVRLGDLDQARRHLASSLALYQRLGDSRGEARTQGALGGLAARQGRYADALEHAQQALRLFEAIGDTAGEASTLNDVGWYHALNGDYQHARVFCRRSLALCAEAGYSFTEGNAWDSLGYAEHHLGSFAEAAACYQRALARHREAGDRFSEADTLTHLGDTHQATGDLSRARLAWQQALAIFDDIQHPNADRVRTKLAGGIPENPSG